MELLNTPPTPNTFNKKTEEVKKIIELCLKNNIKITGTIFGKKADEIEETIDFIKEKFGKQYLIPQIIILSKEHLNGLMLYLQGKGVLDIIINSPGILRLTLSEVINRESYIKKINQDIVTENNTFNPVFGWTRKLFEQKNKEFEDRITSIKR